MKKLMVRTVSGLLYVAIITGGCMLGQPGVTALAALLACLATLEFAKMCNDSGKRNLPVLILDCVMTISLTCGGYGFPLIIWLACMICRVVLELYMENPHPLRNMAHSMMAQVYIGGPLLMMTLIPALTVKNHFMIGTGGFYGWPMLLTIFFMIWINDTGAFLTGSLIGRHKLFERVSPKKTWEGFFGGLVFNLIAGALFCYYGGNFVPYYHDNLLFWLGLGVVVTVFGTWGDLVESLMKRSLNLKDSGNLIPGHGGILDRIDSLLLVAPAALIYLLVFYVGI